MRTHSGTRLSAVLRSCSVTSSEFWRMRCVSWNTTTNYHMYTSLQMHLSRSLVTRHVHNSADALGQKPSHSTWPLLLQCIKPQRLWRSLLVNAWSVRAPTCQLPNMGQFSHQPINWDKHTALWCCVFTAAWTYAVQTFSQLRVGCVKQNLTLEVSVHWSVACHNK